VAVSTAFRRTQLKIGISRDRELAAKLGVTKFPTVLLHNLTHNIIYEGENEYLAMKTNFKKFMMKRLYRIRSAVKVKPLTEYPNSCVGHDTICVIQAVDTVSPDMEAMRWKHRTTMFEFFYGTTGGYAPGSIVVKWPARNRKLDVAKIEDLEVALAQILNGTAVWTETEPEVKVTEEQEEPEAFDDIL
jgi:predicted SprT family Zn-dependent metalloprotease